MKWKNQVEAIDKSNSINVCRTLVLNINLKSEHIPNFILILREMTRVSSGANLDQEELIGVSLP